jgi:group I intron endonuclease
LEVLEYCESADTIKREQYYLDLYKPEYNICHIAGSSLGRITGDETRLKLRNAWLIRLHKNNLSDVSLREYTLDTLTEKLEICASNIAKLFKRFEQIKAATKSKVTMETRLKILASTITSQAVIVTDLTSGVSTRYLSARRAADALGISNSTVMNKLNNKNTKAYKGRYVIKGVVEIAATQGLIKINNIIRTVRSDVLSKLILGVWIFCVRDLKSGSNPDMS